MFPSVQYVMDPLNPGQAIPQFDSRYPGAQRYWAESAAYAQEDADVLAYWNSLPGPGTPAVGNAHNRVTKTFPTWQQEAIHDRELKVPVDPGPPPQPPRKTIVTVSLDPATFTYVLHVDPNGPPLASLPNPLLPPLPATDPTQSTTVAKTDPATGQIGGASNTSPAPANPFSGLTNEQLMAIILRLLGH